MSKTFDVGWFANKNIDIKGTGWASGSDMGLTATPVAKHTAVAVALQPITGELQNQYGEAVATSTHVAFTDEDLSDVVAGDILVITAGSNAKVTFVDKQDSIVGGYTAIFCTVVVA